MAASLDFSRDSAKASWSRSPVLWGVSQPRARRLAHSRWAVLLTSVATAWTLTGCGDDGVTSSGFPDVTSAIVAEAGTEIFRNIVVTLDGPSAIMIDYWTEGSSRLRVTSESETTTHEVFLPRLRAASTYDFEVAPVNSGGGVGEITSGSFQTDPLPPGLAAMQLQVIGSATFPLAMLQILGQLPFDDPAADTIQWPVVVDTDGYVVWFRPERGKRIQGFGRLANGDFVFNTPVGLEVVTPNGQVVAALTEAAAAARSGKDPFNIHHDVIVTPSNTVLFPIQGGSVSVRDTVWVGEELWEWDPMSDDLALRWSSADFFSPETDRGSLTRPGDWLHANSLSFGPRGNVLVSFFFTGEVISIAPDYGSIEWRLSGPGSTFTSTDLLQEGQHTAAEVSPDRVLMFDNGWPGRLTGDRYSRALEIQLDRDAGTAEVAWEFRPEPDIYAPIISSARRLENGNTVVGFGTTADFVGLPSTGPAAVFEVTPQQRVLWRLVVEGVGPFYRATPMEDIAGEQEVSRSN